MMFVNILHKYESRRAACNALIIALALAAGMFADPLHAWWVGMGAFLAVQTSRGTPARQGLYAVFLAVVAIIAGFGCSHYLAPWGWYIALTVALVCSIIFMLNRLAQDASVMQWLLFAFVIMISTLVPAANEMLLANRILFVVTGGIFGIISSLLILPVMPYQEFCHGLLPILNAMIRYSDALAAYLQSNRHIDGPLDKRLLKLEKIMQAPRDEYPEWVFEAGFNRNFRSSFRYILVQIDRITDAFFSLDYHARQSMDAQLLAEIAPHLALVLNKNVELLKIARAFFSGELIRDDHKNFTSDITSIHNSLQSVLPASMELLDISPDYINIAALARDVIDMRELLLQMLSGLPMDDLVVGEHE